MSKVIDVLTNGTPWAITADMFQAIMQIANRENNLEAVLKERGAPLENTRRVEMRDGVAVIHIVGALFPRANLFSSISGAQSVEMLALDLAEAERNNDVHSVVLVFDTPGGQITMINEFSNQIDMFSKPIWAYVAGQACSAGYWFAGAADKIIIDATAMVGSIGVVAGYRKDDSDVIEIVSSNAKDKRPDLTTEHGRSLIQTVVDDTEAVFIEAVMGFRGMSREQVIGLRGGVLTGAKAVEQGFADEIGSLESVILQLQEEFSMSLNLDELKADHNEVYQAAVSVGVQQAESDHASALAASQQATTEATTVERDRISGILASDEAQGRGQMAKHIAFNTAMSPDDAKAMLAAAPKQDAVSGFDAMDAEMSGSNADIQADADNNGDADSMAADLKAFEEVGA